MNNPTSNGLIHSPSNHDLATTVSHLETLITEKEMQIIAKVDHAASAHKIDKELRPTTLLLFGNPQAGTPLMQEIQTAGIDLPQKYLIWEDQESNVWITHNDPTYMSSRHDIKDGEALLKKIATALQAIATAAGK